MELVKIDSIVREALIQKGYPIHFYMQFLSYATSCVRELNFDVLQNIKSVQPNITSYDSFVLPSDYVDYVKLGELNGNVISPWVEDDALSREAFYVDGVRVAPESNSQIVDVGIDGQVGIQNIYINEFGEDLGRRYSHADNVPSNSFKVIRERAEIILASKPSGKFVLEYISDGLSCSSSTCVHPYAVQTIKNYIYWQHALRSEKPNVKLLEDEYYNSERILRGRIDPLDTDEIVRTLRSSNHAAAKQ